MTPEVQQALNITNKAELRAWLSQSTDTQLDEFIQNCSAANNTWQYALAERERRSVNRLATPHPLVWWSLFIAVLSMIFAAIAAWPVIKSWFH